MGLPERRATVKFQEGQLKKLEDDIIQKLGFRVPIETDWTAIIAYPGAAAKFDESLISGIFQPLALAFARVCEDKARQAALKKDMKKIHIKLSSTGPGYQHDNSRRYVLENSVLSIDSDPFSHHNVAENRARDIANGIGKTLGFDGYSLFSGGKNLKDFGK